MIIKHSFWNTSQTEEQVVCTINEDSILEEVLPDPSLAAMTVSSCPSPCSSAPASPLPVLSSHSPCALPRSSIKSSLPSLSSGSTSSSPKLPPRKRQKACGPMVIKERINDVITNIDSIIGKHKESTPIVERTAIYVSAYMSMLSEDRKKDFAAQLMKFINNQPVEVEDINSSQA